MACRPYQSLEQIDHDLYDHVFDDVICKPPIGAREKTTLISFASN